MQKVVIKTRKIIKSFWNICSTYFVRKVFMPKKIVIGHAQVGPLPFKQSRCKTFFFLKVTNLLQVELNSYKGKVKKGTFFCEPAVHLGGGGVCPKVPVIQFLILFLAKIQGIFFK